MKCSRRLLSLWLSLCVIGLPIVGAAAVEYELVGFDRLASFTFTAPEFNNADPKALPPSGADQIPAKIKALDQQKVAVTGYMLPVRMEAGLVKELLLVKDPMMCCYGVMPKINEWVVVKMIGAGVKPLMDVPITFEGKLRVGEMYENGYLTGVYLLEGEKLVGVKG
ncbi:MAG: DUF3299 domain-containing protein [Lacunisphaera sp.]|nr:DUF3299 domain-containing protein [Lacunisphaera sp.]